MQALRSRSGLLRKRGGGREFQHAARGSKEVVLEANNVSKTHDGSRYQLLSFSAAVSRGQRVALLGPNGGGKSSLLSVLSGDDTLLDSGSVVWPHGVSTAYLHQESLAHFHGTVLDAIFSANADLASALTEYRSALASGSTNFLTKSLERMDSLGAWSFEEDAKTMLATLGCDGMEDARVEQLSVGQRQRVAIVATLMKRADVLLLDEPTNSLSIDGVEWLEEYLKSRPNLTLLLVSHDRALLNNTCSTFWEVEGTGPVHVYNGNYRAFLEQREERLLDEQHQIDRTRQVLKKEEEWASKQPRARGTKNKARMEKYENLKIDSQGKSIFSSVFTIDHLPSHRLGKEVVDVSNASLTFTNENENDDTNKQTQALNSVTFSLKHRDRIGIVGKNGAGKSTFLRVLTGDIKLDEGACQIGETVIFGHFEQEPTFPEQKRVKEYIDDLVEAYGGAAEGQETRNLLQSFNFTGDRQQNRIDSLSGGERRRLQLLRLYLQRPNVLLCDEPTTSLDTDSIEAFEQLLHSFDGAVVIVSHDRAFLDKVAHMLLVFEGDGEVWQWVGTYSELRQKQRQQSQQRNQQARIEKTSHTHNGHQHHQQQKENPARRKKRINAPRNIKKVEAQLSELEQRIAQLERQVTDAGSDVERAQELSKELDALKAREDELFEQWEELDQLVQELSSK